MALSPGTRLGPYEIVSALGAGGMGEVYRAHDTSLGRDVAIKILPDTFAHDPERLARFAREAKTLAALNHPNIAHLYGFETSAGMPVLVMELVEGSTLADRIAQGPVPLDEALPIARQVAEALEAAHEQGIVHRDLKPANVKVRDDGTVKVLDFGLAKALEPAAGSPSASQSPTITTPAMTQAGVMMGTAAYMSPEQARGKPADKRSDIWAFGCVLYEMLTGTRPFDAQEVSDTLANVLKIDPDWSVIPPETPPAIRTLLQSCLTKDRQRRVADISTALFVLDKGASLAPPVSPVSAAPLPRKLRWRRVAALAAGALVVAVIVGTVVWVATRPPDPVPPRVSRLPLALPDTAALAISGPDRDLAITPDGSRLVYIGNRGTQVFVRALDALEPVAVFTGNGPRGLFVSPDGQWIGFGGGEGILRKVAITGGPSVPLTPVDGAPRGATWLPDDTIIFATGNPGTGLQRIAAAGGSATVLTRPDRAQGEADHVWPEILPGGRAVLFTITALTGGLDAAQVAVLDLQTGTQTIVLRGGSHAHYVSTGPGSLTRAGREGGYLVYAAASTLRAVAFDLAGLETRGAPVPLIADVQTTTGGGVDAVVAADGTLAYVSRGGMAPLNEPHTLVWVDRQGRETAIPTPPRAYLSPRLSPDGTRVAVHLDRPEPDLWLWDLTRSTLTRLTSEPGVDANPLWTPDGRSLVFRSDRAGASNLFVQEADGTGSAKRVTEGDLEQSPNAITADGTRVVFEELQAGRQRNLRLLTLTPTRRVEPLLETRFDERGGSVSPDGRWLAYQSNSSGRDEIYVRPFPNVGDGQSQVSNAGGIQARWARSGRELFYRTPDGALMAVPVNAEGTVWSAGSPAKLFEGRYHTGDGYDVSPDAQRFLMLKEGVATDQTAAPATLIVVQNWVEELKKLVPIN